MTTLPKMPRRKTVLLASLLLPLRGGSLGPAAHIIVVVAGQPEYPSTR